MSKNMWRFPGNNYTAESGLDTSDMETFKKDPISSLARELCQNSIDARLDNDKPVIVEFKNFQIKNQHIPGKDRLLEEIISCKNEWKHHAKISRQLEEMEDSISKPQIDCLRVSDFNTKGLTGVSTNEKKSWYLLTKGSGISDKTGTTGGSKGIGKFATFVASEFNTVFYNTLTNENEVGYQGISKLCSTNVKHSDGKKTDEKTQGIGYFGSDDKNHPIMNQYSLEPKYKRNEPGTDVYIVGFRKEKTWMSEIITKVLDSFMTAIIFNNLEVVVQNITLSSKTIDKIVFSDKYILKSSRKDIISQYMLLTDEKVYVEPFEIRDYGEVKLYVKSYTKEDMEYATNSCVMVRYPYMKIKTIKNVSSIPCSAMCIIEDNELNEILRDIENPQHTDWEPKRIHDRSKKSEVRGIIRELLKKISTIISEFLSSSDNSQTDVEGASDYLPDSENTDLGDNKFVISENAQIIKPKRNKVVEDVGYDDDKNSTSLSPEIGSLDEDGDDAPMPEGENEGGGGSPRDQEKEGGVKEGDSDVLKYRQLSGIRHRFFVLNKSTGKYAVIFDSPIDEEDCEMKLFYVDDGGNKYPVVIYKALLNNNNLFVEDEHKVKFQLFQNKKYKFELETDQEDLFACEVKLYARR